MGEELTAHRDTHVVRENMGLIFELFGRHNKLASRDSLDSLVLTDGFGGLECGSV